MAIQSFGRYTVIRLLGRGGMAEVYQAHDPLLDRSVAVKVILPHLADEEGFTERFLREAKTVASLRHPHLVQLYDFDVLNGQPFMVMEYLEGGTLKARLSSMRKQGHTMPLGDVASVLQALAGALDYAHAQGAIHRDIKPGNILFTQDGGPVLADFGIAKLLGPTVQQSMAGNIVGTPAYMSPEQASGKPVDQRSDLYSLGVVAYEMAVGRVPYLGDSPDAVMRRLLSESPPALRDLNPNVPLAVEKIILQALAREPADRFADVGEFAERFHSAMHGKALAKTSPDEKTVVRRTGESDNPLPITAQPEQTSPTNPTKERLTDVGAKAKIFVGREPELAQLQAFLDQAQAGHGIVCFVSGEAGAGKTALIEEFVGQTLGDRKEIVAAIGNCNARSGLGDPYLPYRELLARLIGLADFRLTAVEAAKPPADFASNIGRALADHGPDLIDIFLSEIALAAHLADGDGEQSDSMDRLAQLMQAKAESAGQETGVSQSHIFEQYTNVLKALAAEQPLLLAIDDLQWADSASIELLFHLGRRIGDSRILLIGAYRPEDVALGRAGERHPLVPVLNELRRSFGGVEINLRLSQEGRGRQFVNALLDAEPNRFDESFRAALLAHTGGHALFTVELLRNMLERGDLTLDGAGRWMAGPALDWDELPPRVEGVVEERIGRLAADLRETLTVASVEGEDFTAEVVARVQDIETRGLVRRLGQELDRQHRLVGAVGQRSVHDQRLSLYRFRHNLFQKYLYNQLDDAERSYLHEDVGTALEALYGDQANMVSAQLALHFEEAGLGEKTRYYLRLAGERALKHYACAEAVSYLSRALEMTPEADVTQRHSLLLSREKAYNILSKRQAQDDDLTELERLAAASDDPRRQAETFLRRAALAEVTSDYVRAVTEAGAAIALAEKAGDPEMEAEGYLILGRGLLRQSAYVESRTALDQGLALAKEAGLLRMEADCRRALGIVSYNLGDYDGAVVAAREALQLYQALGARRGECTALNNLGNGFADLGRYAESWSCYEEALQVYREIGDREGEGMVLGNLGLISDEQGDRGSAQTYFEQSLRICRDIGARLFEANALTGLGSICLDEHDYARARSYDQEAVAIYREIGDKRDELIAVRNLASVLHHQGDYATALQQFEQVLHSFCDLGDRQGECSALNHLGCLLHDLGDDGAAASSIRQALDIAQEIGDVWQEAVALTNLGRALQGLGQLCRAKERYRGAVLLWRKQGRDDLALESLAGLAQISIREQELADAMAAVEEILSYLATKSLIYVMDLAIYLTCYRVLHAVRDPRADAVLTTAHSLLQQRADGLDAEKERPAYLTNIATHRAIVELWQAMQQTRLDDRSDDLTAVA